MGRLVVVNFVSIDGVIQSPLFRDEDPDNNFMHGGWIAADSDDVVNAFMQEVTVNATGLLLGRRTYDILFNAWARAPDSDPAVSAMNSMPKYVVTSSPSDLNWGNSHSVGVDLPSNVSRVKELTDGYLLVLGSSALVRSLTEFKLVDELRLLQFPVVLGNGKRMFDNSGHFSRFELTGNVTSSSGVVILSYTWDIPS